MADDVRAVFAASLRREREALGLTQEEVARMAGVSRGTVWAAEKGRQGTGLEPAVRIARALGTDIGKLAGGEPEAGRD